MSKPFYLGIDLGTSSVKGILRSPDGQTRKARCGYTGPAPKCWKNAVKELIGQLTAMADGVISAVAISSQVGTYLVNDTDVIPWHSQAGAQELSYILSRIPQDVFVREISMPHPALISYPLPRLMYIQKLYGPDCSVLMPKDLLIREFTGETVTDMYSMRGIANLTTCQYAQSLLEELDIRISLPPLKKPTDLAGYVTSQGAEKYGLPEGTPVYLGCNDFFAGLLGMGICRNGDAFDLTGTSEHIGYISPEITHDGFVSGGYFTGNCTYGGTKASGTSCSFAMENFGKIQSSLQELLNSAPPLFLPYLKGERAPIFDENARGVYFGLSEKTDHSAMSYAAFEGVVFSLYHIAQIMSMPTPAKLTCGGGAAHDPLLNTLKATLFQCPVLPVCENETSAMGACILAMNGSGYYSSLEDACSDCVAYDQAILPNEECQELLLERFAVFKELYPALQTSFAHFHNISTKRSTL